jgi:hypothetical protein
MGGSTVQCATLIAPNAINGVVFTIVIQIRAANSSK